MLRQIVPCPALTKGKKRNYQSWRCRSWLILNPQRKEVETAVANKDAAAAKEALSIAIAEINKAGSKGVYHKNTCARKVSRLAKAVNSIA